MMGRLRRPGTCTLITTIARLRQIIHSTYPDPAKEMAELIISSRATDSLAAACFNLCDGVDAAGSVAVSICDSGVAFNFQEFKQFCQSLNVWITELSTDGTCTFCSIVGNQDPHSHNSSCCPWSKNICNKCFQPGHNRTYCTKEACKIAVGFCVMCLLPVDGVYELHSGRYGQDCKHEMCDCLKPIVSLIYHNTSLKIVVDAARILWPPSRPRPSTFGQYWDWLWLDSGDHIYGILRVLDAVRQAGSQ